MTDEAAILLRVSGFGVVAGLLYWVLSDFEPLGTVALLLLGAGPGFAGLILILEHRQRGGPAESRGDVLRRLAGIPRRDPSVKHDLEAEDLGVLPLPTIWPFAASFGLAILLTGLIYGLWLVVLGGGITAYGAWGWLTAVNRENRYGRIEADTEPASPASGPAEPAARANPGREDSRPER
jgi:hypothetical protein